VSSGRIVPARCASTISATVSVKRGSGWDSAQRLSTCAHFEYATSRATARHPMTKNMLDGGQVIVDYLVREGVPYAFGLCGHGNIQFIDALYERSADIKTISVHHETVAGFMADVYYRVSGKPTATFTSCGPGSVNLPIALACAYLDSVPFL